MLVFLSWSGNKSKAVAETLNKWLPQVIQAVDPWLSSDISKGIRWNSEVSAKLEESKLGIICLSRENLDARWILFEAGALAKISDAYVCTLLLDVTPAEVEPPLSQFQHTLIDKNDIRNLIHTINQAVIDAGERGLPDNTLDNIYETFWPELERSLDDIAEIQESDGQQIRSNRAILEEAIQILRNQERRVSHNLDEAHSGSVEDSPTFPQLFPSRDILTAWIRMRGQAILVSKMSGILRYMRFDKAQNKDVFDKKIAVKNREGQMIVTVGNAKIAIVDNADRELEKFPVSYGDIIKCRDSSNVQPWEELVERDPNSLPIVTEVGGRVAFGDIVNGISVKEEEDEDTGCKFMVVVETASHMRPRIAIKDGDSRATVRIPNTDLLARYLLPVGTCILVDKGMIVHPGDVLAKIPLDTSGT